MIPALLDAVWRIDAVLFLMVLCLSAGAIVSAWIRERGKIRRRHALNEIRRNLEDLVARSPEAFKTACPKMAKEWTIDQAIDIGNIWPPYIGDEDGLLFRECLADCGKIREMEQIALGKTNKWRRIAALRALGCTGSVLSVPVLREALKSKDEDIAYFAMISLSQIQNHESASALLDFLARNASRGHKIVSLLEHFPPEITHRVLETAHDSDERARYWAIMLLAKLKPGAHLKEIEGFARDPSPDVRAAACECLGELGNREAEGALLKCLHDKIWYVQMHAIRALSKLSGADYFEEFLGLMRPDASDFVKASVKNALVQDMDKAIPHIRLKLQEGDESTKRFCVQALVESNYVTKILNDTISSQPQTREEARELLRLMVKSGIYFGLKRSLNVFAPEASREIVKLVEQTDAALAASL